MHLLHLVPGADVAVRERGSECYGAHLPIPVLARANKRIGRTDRDNKVILRNGRQQWLVPPSVNGLVERMSLPCTALLRPWIVGQTEDGRLVLVDPRRPLEQVGRARVYRSSVWCSDSVPQCERGIWLITVNEFPYAGDLFGRRALVCWWLMKLEPY